MIPVEFNYLAIVIAGLVYFFIGALWYSAILFQKPWMEDTGMTEENAPDPKKAMTFSALASIILAFGMAYVLGVSGLTGIVNGALLGFGLGVLIHMMASYPHYAFENKPVRLFLINSGYGIVGMTVIGIILTAWV